MGWQGYCSSNEIKEQVRVQVMESPQDPGTPPPKLKAGDTVPVEFGNNARTRLDVVAELPADEVVVKTPDATRWRMSKVKPGEIGSAYDPPRRMVAQDWAIREKL
ncbi:hypothetical protein C7I87_24250 [Mesorhizobium sp. SARCC-RB16n]|uniref:hypothetical protein n=1 Tax=Mesorhizobium sp. SARCC-RB16n TaxID=2116687 RepID=UPI00122EAB1D|nr:hypothetical protein [Mesorhizobium sp. SARCC-RB16n]KAA3448053.1 hypothetical protein C7I87_24250 [Mesorhizobium sp. SARCC-RB16n]